MSNYTNNWQTVAGGAIGSGIASGTMPSLSLSNITSQTAAHNWINDLSFDSGLMHENANVKRYEIIETSQDLLVLSATWYRLRKERTTGKMSSDISRLTDASLFRNITDEDRMFADTIRDYYSKKVLVWKLRNSRLTAFREDLCEFINTDGKKFKEQMLPLAYRLPEFYQYDIEFEKLVFDFNREIKGSDENIRATKTLTFVKQLSVNTKRFKRNEFWFNDTHNNLINITIDSSNPLLSLLTKATASELSVEAYYKKMTRDGNEYLKADKLQFV